MIKSALTAIALLGLSAPAFASDVVTASSSTAAQQAAAARAAAQRSERVCIRMELTGTRVVRNVCRTRAEWDRLGGVPSMEE